MKKGYIQVYTGDGKGKTTAALGLALRAAGNKMHSYIGQFMKGQFYGELKSIERIPEIDLEQYGDIKCIRREDVTSKHIDQAMKGLDKARQAMLSGNYDIVILDEINVSIWFGLLSINDVIAFIDLKPESVELILTGRKAPEELITRADLVTEMREIKHYYQNGVDARKGVER